MYISTFIEHSLSIMLNLLKLNKFKIALISNVQNKFFFSIYIINPSLVNHKQYRNAAFGIWLKMNLYRNNEALSILQAPKIYKIVIFTL